VIFNNNHIKEKIA